MFTVIWRQALRAQDIPTVEKLKMGWRAVIWAQFSVTDSGVRSILKVKLFG